MSAESGDSRGMTVLHIDWPGRAGGRERVVEMLARGQAATGHRVHVCAVATPGAVIESYGTSLHSVGVEVHEVRVPQRAYLRERAAVANLCRRLQPTVVHTHGYRPDVLDAGAARALAIPTITSVHGFTGGDLKNRVYQFLQRVAFRRFSAVIAVSRPLVTWLIDRGVPRERIHCVPNAWLSPGALLGPREARLQWGITEQQFHIGWVGRLSHEKGADVLLAAAARLRDLPIGVSIVGEGRERLRLEAEARRLGLNAQVRFHGMVADAGRAMAGFDLLVLSSRTEGTPIVLFEAMAAGTPVVATRVGGVPDVVSEREALLVRPNDPEALGAAIREVHTGREAAARRAAAARRRLEHEFAPEPWLARHEEIYRRAAGLSRSGPPHPVPV
jgi:L-malate glycosyltransferase